MKKVIFEREKCLGCGTCTVICPFFWKMGEDGRAELKGGVKKENGFEIEIEEVGCLEEAKKGCPVQCIHIEEV